MPTKGGDVGELCSAFTHAIVLAVLGIVATGCAASGFQSPDAFCGSHGYSAARCAAIVENALANAGVDRGAVTRVELDRPEPHGVNLGGSLAAVVRMHIADGRAVDHEVRCVGVGTQYLAWCVDDPELELWFGGNHDVPCSGEPPAGCATPIVLDPAAVAAARPLHLEAIDIPATVGYHEVELGTVELANGYLDRSSFTLADPAPDGVVVPDGIHLEVRPTDPTRPPFGNVYDRGIVPGVEEAKVVLVFEVIAAPDGAMLQVRDVDVR